MPRRVLEGKVVSDAQDKTVTVLVERRFKHPLYKKYVKQTKKFAAHDENNTAKVGDLVAIEECRPISKRKRWTLISGDAAAAPAAKESKPAAKAAPKKEEAKAAPKKATAEKKPAAKKPAAKKTTSAASKKKTDDKK